MNHSNSNRDPVYHSEKSLSRHQTIGLALFALFLIAILVLYGPYTILTMVYARHLENAPPEIRNLSGPAVMGLWGITCVSAWLFMLIMKAYFTKSEATIENLAGWSMIMTILFACCFLGFLYVSIRYDIRVISAAGGMFVMGLSQTLIAWLLSKASTQAGKC